MAQSSNVRLENLLSLSRAIFIIDKSGILLHHENFIDQYEDPDLYAGLFTALNVFASELDAGMINAITLEENKFIIVETEKDDNLIVMDVHTSVADEDGQWLLSMIKDRYSAMEALMADDHSGSLSLQTLFDELGKTIDWDIINDIRRAAVADKKAKMDIVETLNLTKITVNNRFWVKLRRMTESLVSNQKGVVAIVIAINNIDHVNILYSGREGVDRVKKLINYIEKKFYQGVVGLELEVEFIQIDDLFVGIHNLFAFDGGIIGVASVDKYLITNRLSRQLERYVTTIEKLTSKMNI